MNLSQHAAKNFMKSIIKRPEVSEADPLEKQKVGKKLSKNDKFVKCPTYLV